MARLRQSGVGKPSASRVAGEGEQRVVQMGDAGQVFKMSGSVPRDGISRDPGQHSQHMRSNVDPVVQPLNKGKDAKRPDKWTPHSIHQEG